MKKSFLVFLIFFISVSNAYAQYVRKLKEPDFFIPYDERMHKPEVLPSLQNQVKTNSKTHNIKEKVEISFKSTPEYKKIYDGYLEELNNFILTKKFNKQNELDADLGFMNSNDYFEVEEDKNPTIDTKEQYDFYMLAKDLL